MFYNDFLTFGWYENDKIAVIKAKNKIKAIEKPTITSGIRVGTPAVTTRGFKEEDMIKIAELIDETVNNYDTKKEYIREEVDKICKKYPLYEK
mgnify:CR=1 FL=1